MTARRTFLMLVAGLALGPCPACILIGGSTSSTPETVPPATKPKNEFAILPTRPGEVVRTNIASKPGAGSVSSPTPLAPTDTTDTATNPPRTTPPASDPETPPITVTAAKVEHAPSPDEPPPPAGARGTIGLPVEWPERREPPVLAAMRAYIENRPDDAMRLLQPLSPGNQDLVLAVMPLLVRGSQVNLSAANPAEVSVLVDQLRGVATRLEGKAPLQVGKVAFCRGRVLGYGQYAPWPEAQPYRPNDMAVLYVEAQHVSSAPAVGPNGESFVSRAVVSMEVRDAAQRLVEMPDPADHRQRVTITRYEHTDFTHSPITDYYQTYRIRLPAQPGVYTVTVEVRDPVGGRTARSQPTQFMVAGP